MLEIVLGIRFSVMYHVSHMFCNITIVVFSRGLSFYDILIDADWNSQWRRQFTIFNSCSSFSNATISVYFSIRGLFKFFLIFPCHIIFLIIIVLHLLLCGISNLISLTKSLFVLTSSISYVVFYSLTIYFTCGFQNCKSFWAVM